jgi:hypothetical protein
VRSAHPTSNFSAIANSELPRAHSPTPSSPTGAHAQRRCWPGARRSRRSPSSSRRVRWWAFRRRRRCTWATRSPPTWLGATARGWRRRCSCPARAPQLPRTGRSPPSRCEREREREREKRVERPCDRGRSPPSRCEREREREREREKSGAALRQLVATESTAGPCASAHTQHGVLAHPLTPRITQRGIGAECEVFLTRWYPASLKAVRGCD